MNDLNIVLLGAPGSGKGTQALLLSDWLGIPHISTGEIFRKEIQEGKSALSNKIKAIISEGNLVPDAVVLEVIQKRLSESDCLKGFLLDGFPRTLVQAKMMPEYIPEEMQIRKVVFLDVSHDDLFKRLTGRRLCADCGKMFNVYFSDIKGDRCPECGGKLLIRDDDKPETVENRLKVYVETTFPLVDFYRQQGILVTVDGNRTVETVFEELKEVFIPHG